MGNLAERIVITMPFTSTKLKMDEYLAGMPVDNSDHDTESYVNEEASAELPWGVALVQGTADRGAKLAAAQANRIIGVARREDAYGKDSELGSTGLKPKVSVSVTRRGKLPVLVNEAVAPTSPVRVRMTTNAGANGTNSGPGTFCTTASAGHTVLISSGARFLSTTAGAGIAILAFDFTPLSVAVAD